MTIIAMWVEDAGYGTCCTDEITNDVIALEEKEEDTKELDNVGLSLLVVQYCHSAYHLLFIVIL